MSDEGGIDAVIKGHRQAKVRHWRGDADQSMREVVGGAAAWIINSRG